MKNFNKTADKIKDLFLTVALFIAIISLIMAVGLLMAEL